jgi:asparagine synthase (glutamine-hydrolysing)
MGYMEDAWKADIFQPEVARQMGATAIEKLGPVIDALEEPDIVSRIMHLDALTFLEGNGLFQADRMTMATSLEARVPLLNNDLIDFVSGLPTSVKMAGGTLKAVLKELLRPHLPKAIIDLRKKGFGPPSANWLRTVLRPTFETVFSHDRVAAQGIFKPEAIARLTHEHMTRKRDHGRLLWLMLSFQLWYDHFIAAKA